MEAIIYDRVSGHRLGTANSPEEVQEFMAGYGGILTAEVRFNLDMPLTAEVVRGNGPDMVVLTSGDKTKSVQRSVGGDRDPEKLAAQCEPQGDKVPAKAIILHIPGASGQTTDRGVVWTIPQTSAWAHMTIRPRTIRELRCSAFDIIEAARKEVKEKIVDRFLN